MPRQLRLEYPGAIYHLKNRGDGREPFFNHDLDEPRINVEDSPLYKTPHPVVRP